MKHRHLAVRGQSKRRQARKLRLECLENRLPFANEIEPNNSLALANPMSPDIEMLGRTSNNLDEDWYKLSANYGETLVVFAGSSDTVNVPEVAGGLELYDSAGRLIGTETSDDEVRATAPQSGTYYVRMRAASAYGDITGLYALYYSPRSYVGTTEVEPNDTQATARSASLDQKFRGTLSTAADQDFYSISGNAGDLVSIDLINRPGESPSIIVYNPDGSELSRGEQGFGHQFLMPTAGTYRFAVVAAGSSGVFTGQYVGYVTKNYTGTIPPPANVSFDTAQFINLPSYGDADLGGMLDSLSTQRVYSFDLNYLSYVDYSVNKGGGNIQIILYNDKGQILDKDVYYGGTQHGERAFEPGRYFLSVRALTPEGLGPFNLDIGNGNTFSAQRDNALMWLDIDEQQAIHRGSAWVAPFAVPQASGFMQGLLESRFNPWDVEVTFNQPPSGTEYMAQGYGNFGPLKNNVGGSSLGGNAGTRRPSSQSITDCRQTTWTTLSYGCMSTSIHEFTHDTGLSHARNVQSNLGYDNEDEVIPPGSIYNFNATEGYLPLNEAPSNPRDYLDWALTPGRQVIATEPNDTSGTAMPISRYIDEMKVAFADGPTSPIDGRATEVELINVNNDQWPDLIAANDVTDGVSIHLGTGPGSFALGNFYSAGFNVPFQGGYLAVGDVNGDGREDAVLAGNTSNTLALFITNSNGTLTGPISLPGGTGPDAVRLHDLNSDGRLDLLTGNSNGKVGIQLGNGDGTFQTRQEFTASGAVSDLAVADIDRDGVLDIVTCSSSSLNVSVLRGLGPTSYQAPVSRSVGTNANRLKIADMNGDSNPDVVVMENFGVGVMLGNGTTTLNAIIRASTINATSSIDVDDLNSDGIRDIMYATPLGVNYLLGNGNGTFAPTAPLTTTSSGRVFLRDLNADGIKDILITGQFVLQTKFTQPNDVRNDRIVIYGQISSPTDLDYYSFTAQAGQKFSFDVEAAEFQRPLDAVLQLYDSGGTLLAQSDDALDRDTGITSVDPYLTQTFATAGTYTIAVRGKSYTTGTYRFKITPGEAWSTAPPKVIGTIPANNEVRDARRQIVFFLNDQLDPATLTAANIVVQGTTTGLRTGIAAFDPFDSTLLWTADAVLPLDNYTVTLRGGATGIRDLKGNLLDGETDGSFDFPEVSGNGTAGGDFSFGFRVGTTDNSPGIVAASYLYNPYNRGRFRVTLSDEILFESAQLLARGAGPDGTFDTADDRVLPLDVLQDPLVDTFALFAYTRGVPNPDRYRIEGTVRDQAGFSIPVSTVLNVAVEVPGNYLFTNPALTQTGLVGSYVNANLQSYAVQDDWRVTQTISGTRVDPRVDFSIGTWGTRAEVGVTGGSDFNWGVFSTQWDGWISIPVNNTRLSLSSADSSRLWIDLNGDGNYASAGDEFVDNFWGENSSVSFGGKLSVPLAAGNYRIRMQYYSRDGAAEEVHLNWITPDLPGEENGVTHPLNVVGTSIRPNTVLNAGGINTIDVLFSGAIDPATLTTSNFRVRYSPDATFFNGNDSYLSDSDGLIGWNAAQHKATFSLAQPLQHGYYILELNGKSGGIADPKGRLLDGEFLNSYIAGNVLPSQWQDTPSGDGLAGGDYIASFSVVNFTASLAAAPASTSEDGSANLVYTFTRTGDIASAGTVNFAVGGTASFGTDYTQTGATSFTAGTGSITFAAGATTATLTIDPTADANLENDESVVITLSPSASYNVGTAAVATSYINNDEPVTFRIAAATLTSTGAVVDFNRQLNDDDLNLYDISPSTFGAADLTLVGAAVGNVKGSLVVDPFLRKVTFVKTSGLLAPDTYTLTLRSAADGFHDASLNALDGDADGTAGGDYVQTLVVAPPAANAVTLSVANFARGPLQPVNVPANVTTGLPIAFSSGTGITSASFELRYNPALLTISGATVAPGLPAGASVLLTTSTPGVAMLQFTSPTPLTAGVMRFVDLQAAVPEGATYREKQVLDLANIVLNGGAIPAIDDDAVHVNNYLGDTSGNGTYSGTDATNLARLVVGIGNGLPMFKLLDPAIIADVTGNGSLSGSDTTRVQQITVVIPVAEIPRLPLPAASLTLGGPDPKLSIPQDLVATAGGDLTIPVHIDSIVDLTGNGLESGELVIYYDATVFDLQRVELGALLRQLPGNWTIGSRIDPLAGRVFISFSGLLPLEGVFQGELVQLQAKIKTDATPGPTAINLAAAARDAAIHTQLNEGWLTLIPAPTDAANDPDVDGVVSILPAPTAALGRPTAQLVDNTVHITGTSGDDFILVAPLAGDRLRVRAGSQILGTFPRQAAIVLNTRSGSDQVYVAPLNVPTFLVEPNSSADINKPSENSATPAHDLALLQVLDGWLTSQTTEARPRKSAGVATSRA